MFGNAPKSLGMEHHFVIREDVLENNDILQIYGDGMVFKINSEGKKIREKDLTKKELEKLEKEIDEEFEHTFKIINSKKNKMEK